MEFWIAFLALLPIVLARKAGKDGELLMTTAPRAVYPDITPSFSLNCALLENEEARIVSMAITRRTAALGNVHRGLPERLVSLNSTSPITPMVETSYKGLTTLGQITNIESEAGSYLQLVWPTPTVADLGLYTCETVVIGKRGQLVTLVAQALVTSGQPVLDRVLLTLYRLETTLDVFNITLQDLQQQVDNVTAIQQEEIRKDVAEAGKEATTTMAPETTTPMEIITTEGTPEANITADPLERLAMALDNLAMKLNLFNASIVSMERKIDRLGRGTEDKNNNTSEGPDHVQNFFSYNTSIFFLISGPRDFTSVTAQAVCQSQSIYLAEIQDGQELDAIADNGAPYVWQDQLVLIGGRRAADSNVWRYQDSGTQTTFFGGAAAPEGVASEDLCLALKKTLDGMVVVGVACSQPQPGAFVLCEDELFVSSGEAETTIIN